MSKWYSVTAGLDEVFSEKSVSNLIDRASAFGFVFYAFDDIIGKPITDDPRKFLIPKEVLLKKIFKAKSDLFKVIYAKFHGAALGIMFSYYEMEDTFSIGWQTAASWERPFAKEQLDDEDEKIFLMDDNARHSRLLLDLVEPFKLNYFSIGELYESLDSNYIIAVPTMSLLARILSKVNKWEMVSMLTKNILYSKCIMLECWEPIKVHHIKEFSQRLYDHLWYDASCTFYIQHQSFFLKVVLKEYKYEEYTLTLTPLPPLKTQTIDIDVRIDVPFYAHILLGLCEDFPILRVETNF